MERDKLLDILSDSAGNIESLEKLEKKLENQSNNPNNNETKEQKQERAFQQALVYFIAERTLAETDKELEKQLKLDTKIGNVLVIGLPKSGKSTMLKTLKANTGGNLILNGDNEELQLNNIKISIFNCLGDDKDRVSGVNVDAIIFLIDANNPHVFLQAKKELANVLINKNFSFIPIMILITKTDLDGAVSESNIRDVFDIPKNVLWYQPAHDRVVFIVCCNLHKHRTFACAFRYISCFLKDL